MSWALVKQPGSAFLRAPLPSDVSLTEYSDVCDIQQTSGRSFDNTNMYIYIYSIILYNFHSNIHVYPMCWCPISATLSHLDHMLASWFSLPLRHAVRQSLQLKRESSTPTTMSLESKSSFHDLIPGPATDSVPSENQGAPQTIRASLCIEVTGHFRLKSSYYKLQSGPVLEPSKSV